jgi:hypothetical protein
MPHDRLTTPNSFILSPHLPAKAAKGIVLAVSDRGCRW